MNTNIPTSRPNLIFILVDDLGWRDLSCTGSDFYETPNIDRLASEGIRFTRAYAAAPVCSPTRASLLSGKYPARLGVTNWIGPEWHQQAGSERGKMLSAPYIPHLPLGEKSLAARLREEGYATWHVGKWHLGGATHSPEAHGFDRNIGGGHMGHPGGRGGYFVPWDLPNLPPKEGDDYLTDRIGDEAAALIRSAGSRPFFLNLCFYQVHTPLMAKPDKIAKYEAKAHSMGLDRIDPLEDGGPFPCEHKRHERILRRTIQSHPVYAAMIEHLDENVGKVLAALEETGLAKNTLVVFTSDNGGLSTAEGSPTCNLPLAEGKGWMYEGGNREPLLARWPGHIPPDSVSHTVVTSPDFYPTFLEAAGLPSDPQQHCDGKSFLPSLLDPTRRFERGPVFWHYPHYGNQGGEPASAILDGDWKLIEFFHGPVELFNLAEDEGERTNLSHRHPAITARLLEQLRAWRKDIGALEPAPNPDWKPWSDPSLDPTA
jgi:arylsulfatase A-like enzyme